MREKEREIQVEEEEDVNASCLVLHGLHVTHQQKHRSLFYFSISILSLLLHLQSHSLQVYA